jgi:hypothetical protein
LSQDGFGVGVWRVRRLVAAMVSGAPIATGPGERLKAIEGRKIRTRESPRKTAHAEILCGISNVTYP